MNDSLFVLDPYIDKIKEMSPEKWSMAIDAIGEKNVGDVFPTKEDAIAKLIARARHRVSEAKYNVNTEKAKLNRALKKYVVEVVEK
jgi:hypothetical protein